MATKICVQCGAEYLPEAQQCADCGGRLEYVGNSQGSDDPATPEQADWMVVFTGPHGPAARLRDSLEAMDVSARQEERGDLAWSGFHAMDPDQEKAGVFEVLVQPHDLRLAGEVRDRLGLPAEAAPELVEFVEGSCPACGHALPEESVDECPDCGLSLGGGDDDDDLDDAGPGHAPPPASGWLPHHPD